MPDVTIAYKNSTITSLSSSGTIALSTAGKYLEDDLTITYTVPLPNLSSINIKPENCMSISSQITPETYICETDSSYPGTVISFNNTQQKDIGNPLPNNIKIELNKTYHCDGQLLIKWDDDNTEEYYYINSDFKITSYTTIVSLSFTWEGSTGAVQTFDTIYIKMNSYQPYGYQTILRVVRNGAITKSGILLPESFYRITQVDTEGYETINLDFDSDPRFYGIYQSLAYRSTITSSARYVSEWCNSLSRIVGWQFAGQQLAGSFTFNNVTSVSQGAFGVVWNGNGTSMQTSAWFNFPNSALSILYQDMFLNNGMIRGISANNVNLISTTAFCSCMNLSEVNFPNCTTISNSAFQSCRKLATISFPKCATISTGAFQSCSSLTTISFPECTTIGGNAFSGCSNLTTISFPECTSIGGNAFQGCSNLTTVSFPKCTSISGYAFQNCSNLITISFPLCTTISGAGTFSNCTALQEVYFPECTIIYGQYVFRSCTSLSVISFPKLTSISAYAFQNCINLQSAYFMGSSIPDIGAGLFQSTPMSLSSYLGYFGSIYVPASLLASYKTATNWAAYSARMVGI